MECVKHSMRTPIFLEPKMYKVDSCIILRKIHMYVTDFLNRFARVHVELRDNSTKYSD